MQRSPRQNIIYAAPCHPALPPNPFLPHIQSSIVQLYNQRTEMPDRLVNMRVAIFIDANSWNRSFAAYGIWIWDIFVLFLQGRHSKDPVLILL